MHAETPRLYEIKARCAQATPGPWNHRGDGFVETGADDGCTVAVMCGQDQCAGEPLPSLENAEFVAHARTDVPELVSEVERLRLALTMIAEGRTLFPGEFARRVLGGELSELPLMESAAS